MDAREIQESYRRKLQNDNQLKKIRKKVADGDLSALQKYSIRAGELSVETLKDRADDLGGSEEELMDSVFRANYQAVENASQTAQKSANESSGFGLNPSAAAYVSTAAVFASKLSGYEDVQEGLNALKYDIVLQSQRYADDSERRSADFASNSGVEVLVSREYDDVGVHTTDKGGGEDCQWCKARCGTNVPLKEAYARGMFERHPGCGCIITYKTKKGKFRQGKGDWEHNQWAEESDWKREKSIKYAETDTDVIHFPKSIGAKWGNYDVKDVDTGEIYHFVEGSSIINPTTFAGYGTKSPLNEDVKKGLTEKHPGTDPEKWEHRKGSGHLDVHGEDTLAEVHWFQQPGIKCGFKVKKWLE